MTTIVGQKAVGDKGRDWVPGKRTIKRRMGNGRQNKAEEWQKV